VLKFFEAGIRDFEGVGGRWVIIKLGMEWNGMRIKVIFLFKASWLRV